MNSFILLDSVNNGGLSLITTTLLDLFNNGGIPLIMAAYIYYQGKLHREEVSKLSEALNDQTKAVVEMTAKVEVLLNEYTRNIDDRIKGDKRS